VEHWFPHAPQFSRSTVALTQLPSHRVSSGWQPVSTQAPPRHVRPAPQATPQPPQWPTSTRVSTQAPAQSVWPTPQVDVPTSHRFATHTVPVGQGGSPGLPQKYSVVRLHPPANSRTTAPASAARMEDVGFMGAPEGRARPCQSTLRPFARIATFRSDV
jgi:hypothetical protein